MWLPSHKSKNTFSPYLFHFYANQRIQRETDRFIPLLTFVLVCFIFVLAIQALIFASHNLSSFVNYKTISSSMELTTVALQVFLVDSF